VKYVVKLGGAGLAVPALFQSSMRAITELVRSGNQVAVVHGGGSQLTQTLKALGKESKFVNGLRVTDAETRDAAIMVLAGKVNKSLVAALGALGQPAMGLSGGTASSSAPAKSAAPLKPAEPILAMLARSPRAIRAGLTPSGSSMACPSSRQWLSASTVNTTT